MPSRGRRAGVILESASLLFLFGLVVFGAAVGARWLKRPIDPASLFLFCCLPVLFLFPGFFADRTPIPLDHVLAHNPPWNAIPHPYPHNPSLNDIATQFAPWAKAVRMAWKEGSIPFWNRWNGCGMPLAANGQSQAFSPFTFLMLALPLARAFVLLGASKLFLALSGMWLWLRELGASIAAARFGAVAFAFSFAMTPWLYHPATAEICLWPWIFFAAELLADSGGSRRAFAALLLLLPIWPLCGHLETVAIGALFGGLWFGLRAVAGDLRRPLWVLGRASLAALLALGLSAFSLLPQLHALAASNRLVLAGDPAHLDYVPWVPYKPGWLGGFVTSLFPLAFGDMIASPMIPGAAGSIIEMGFGYFGVVAWSCVLLLLRSGSRRSAKEWTLLALVLLGLGGAMGLPIVRTLVQMLPGVRFAPPLRLLLLVSAAGVPLATLELDRLIRDRSNRGAGAGFLAGTSFSIAAFALIVFLLFRGKHAALGGLPAQRSALIWTLVPLLLTAAAAVLFTRKIVQTPAFVLLITALAAVELLHQGARLYRFYSGSALYPETPLIRFLRSRPEPYRIVGDQSALFPNTNVFAGVETVATHDPAERRDYVEFLDQTAGYPPFDYFKTIRNLNSNALDFLNVKYLVTPPGRQAPGSKWTAVYEGPDGNVFENRAALPRFFTPARIEVASAARSGEGALVNAIESFGKPLQKFLAAGTFSDRALILGRPTFRPVSGRNGVAQIGAVVEKTNQVRFSASVPTETGPTAVVSSVVEDGGWSARDERGNRLATSLANGPFLAVALPAGRHVVTLTYVPPGLRPGLALTALAALTTVGFLLRQSKRGGAVEKKNDV